MYACIGISTLITPFTLSCISPYPLFFFFFPVRSPQIQGLPVTTFLKQMVQLYVTWFKCMWHLFFFFINLCDGSQYLEHCTKRWAGIF